MKRAIILVLDSFGVGACQDASDYGDEKANTFLHIKEYCDQGLLHIPNLEALGLYAAVGLPSAMSPIGCYGVAQEMSKGKDTQSGHFEMAGCPVLFDWGYFPEPNNSFPQTLIAQLVEQCELPGVLGLCHASGTAIIDEFGEKHMRTDKPIVYTSADSVFQIAAHEQTFGLRRLYQVCEVARQLVDDYHIGRVIARPFIGQPGEFMRTAHRKDYAIPPHGPTLLDHVLAKGGEVIAVGKIADIFAHRSVSIELKAANNNEMFDQTLAAMNSSKTDPTLIFTNFVDFDTLYGHRRDINGYARALTEFDRRLPELLALLQPEDLVIITADHGCDPSFHGSDHTREKIPILAYSYAITPQAIGCRESFADIGQTVAKHLGVQVLPYGKTFN